MYDDNGDVIGFIKKEGNSTSEYYYGKNLQGDVTETERLTLLMQR